MNKCHVPITWVNDQTPAINDTHLNQYDGELDTLDDRVITLDTTKAAQSDMLLAFKDVSLNSTTGVITFTLFNNTTKTIDTLLEKIAINFDYDDDPTSPHYQNLIIELEDGTYKYIDMSALITEYEFDTSSTVAFTVANDGTVTADVIDGSITTAKIDPTFAVAINDAEANGLKSEGWAVGEQNGTPVTSGSPYYENNAKYWKEQAQAIAQNSFSGLSDTDFNNLQDGQVAVYNSISQMWENEDLPDAPTVLYPQIEVTADTGATVTVTKGGTTITATEVSTGLYRAEVKEYGTWTVSAVKGIESGTSTVNVDAVKFFSTTISMFGATITVNYPDNMRGQTFTCTTGGITLTETAPNNANVFNFYVPSSGTWTVTGAYSKSVTITTNGETKSLTFYALKTFATATDQEIADMVSEADLGLIDLYDDAGWRVEQEHSVSLSSIAASGTYDGITWTVGKSESAQTVVIVLTERGGKTLVNPVLDKQGQTRTECSFQWDLKAYMAQSDYMNPTASNAGSWASCARRNWCNGGFRGALPASFRSAIKQFEVVTATEYNSSSNTTTNDYVALRAEKEVCGTADYCTTTEAAALTQITYYRTQANRCKINPVDGNAYQWWCRSPGRENYYRFVDITGNGSAYRDTPTDVRKISPFGVF